MASRLRTATCFALVIPVSLYTYVFLFQTLGLAALPGFFIHGHVIAGSGYRKAACFTGQMCGLLPRGPSLGVWPAARWDFSLAGFWAGAEVFCEVSSCSCLQTFLCPLFHLHSDNQGG